MEGKPIDQVREMWTAYARGGIAAMHAVVGDQPVPPSEFWGEWGLRESEQVQVTVHSFEEHGPCVLAHGSMRSFREGGFSDVQPSWVYFFRDGVLVRGAGYATREAAVEAIRRFRES